jgi:hypothetical protein
LSLSKTREYGDGGDGRSVVPRYLPRKKADIGVLRGMDSQLDKRSDQDERP